RGFSDFVIRIWFGFGHSDFGFGSFVRAELCCKAGCALIVTFEPVAKRNCPSVTTVSPALTPFWISVIPCVVKPAVIARFCTVASGCTTNTKSPLWLDCTACEGTTTACASVFNVRIVCTYCPGHSAESSFGKVAFNLIRPVVGSTVLSMKLSSPRGSTASPDGTPASVGACGCACTSNLLSRILL